MCSHDPLYTPTSTKLSACSEMHAFTEQRIFYLLDHLHPTSTGLDKLPFWFLCIAAIFFTSPLTHLLNLSIQCSHVPRQWKAALICPIPKIVPPTLPEHFRPISVTPVLPRIMEKEVVRTYLYPAILAPPHGLNFFDQFAFHPSGSTSVALISILNHVSIMLTTNPYVH